MKKYKLDKDFLQRYQDYLKSTKFFESDDYQKTDYWKHHSGLFNVDIKGSRLSVEGSSGFYVPKKTYFDNLTKFYRVLITSPSMAISKIIDKIISFLNVSGHFSPEKAFDLIASFNPDDLDSKEYIKAFSARSGDRLNLHKVCNKKGSFSSIKEVIKSVNSRYILNTQMVFSYYVYNIINSFLSDTNALKILEIGGGNGNLMSVLHDNCPNSTIIDVDLPETLSSAILFIKEMYPDSKILLPNEIDGKSIEDYDFVFITPSQLEFIENSSIDIAVNISSFQEMTRQQISHYFNFIHKAVKEDGIFLSVNRVEKLFESSSPIRFSEYPWREKNEILAYEIDPFFHLTCPSDHYLKVEKIIKENDTSS